MTIAHEAGIISEEIVRNAFSATEDGFLAHVQRMHPFNPVVGAIDSFCLVISGEEEPKQKE
jgi:pyruvate dehydrogenase phosphatase